MNLAAFQQSAFLQSLGWAIANSVWQGGLLWIVYQIIVSSYTNASAKFKNNSSTIFLFITFLWFVVTFFSKFIYLQNSLANVIETPFLFSTPLYSSPGGLSLPNFVSYIAITLPYLSVAYLFLLLIFTIKLFNSYHNTNIIRHKGLQKPPVEWRLFVEKVTRHIGIHKKIKLWFSMYVDVPATIGFLKPVILIPVASLNQLTPDQLEAIILHELSHIKRNDYLINIFISLIETVLFFNPFVALMSKIIKKERENCCDDFVLQYQYDRHSYASALLCLEKYRNQNFRLALTATSGKKQLLLRIKRIMDVKNSTNSLNYGQKLLALLLVTGIICSVAWLAPAKKTNQHISSTQTPLKTPEDLQPKTIKKESNALLKVKPGRELITISIPKNQIIARNPVISDHIAQPQNTIEGKQEDWFSFNIDDNEGENQEFTANPNIHENISAKNHFPPSPHFSFDSNFLQNLSFKLYLDKIKVDIEKNEKFFSAVNWDNIEINWDNLGQGILKSLEKIKIPEVNISVGDPKNWPVPGNDQLEKLREKNIQNEFQFQLLNECPDKKVNMQNMAIDLLRHKGINFSFISDDAERTHRQVERNNHRTIPSSPPQKRKRTEVIVPAPVPGYSEDENSDGEVTYSRQYLLSDKKSPESMFININYPTGPALAQGKKIISSVTKKSGQETLAKKLLIVINQKMAGIRLED